MEPTNPDNERNPPEGNTAVSELKNQLSSLEQQVTNAAKHEGRSFELLKWGMGTFITIAIVFAGFNWWTGKANYDRDRENLKQASALMEQMVSLQEKEASMSGEKRLEQIQSKLETNFAGLATLNDKRYQIFREEAQTNIEKLVVEKTSQFPAILTNLLAAVSNFVIVVNTELSNSRQSNFVFLDAFSQTNLVIVSNLMSSTQRDLCKAEAISLSVQANQCCNGNKANTDEEFIQMAIGVASLATAGKDWIVAGDEGGLRRWLATLDRYFPVLWRRWYGGGLSQAEDLNGIADHIDQLTEALRQPSENNRYDMEAMRLQLYNRIYKKAVQEDRELKISKPTKR